MLRSESLLGRNNLARHGQPPCKIITSRDTTSAIRGLNQELTAMAVNPGENPSEHTLRLDRVV